MSRSAAQPREFRFVLLSTLDAGRRARQVIRQRFSAALTSATMQDLLAVVTELVNNSVQHGPGRSITVVLGMGRDSIRGRVADQGNPAVAVPQVQEATESGGRGLDIVDKLTSQWAVCEGSTHVWFEIPLES
jgi:anti-sigma regulatory factor (Ser/Thr protein kinase)